MKQIDLSVALSILGGLVTILVGVVGILRSIREEMHKSYGLQQDILNLEKLKKWLDISDTANQLSPKVESFLSSIDVHVKTVRESLTNNSASGEKLYYSTELSEFRDVAHYYEKLASLVKMNFLQFDVVFATLPFPDRWWKETAELRSLLKTNWFGLGQELKDFLENFEWLRIAYLNARRGV